MSFHPQNVMETIFNRASFLNSLHKKLLQELHQERTCIRNRWKLPSTDRLSPHSPGISGWNIFSLDKIEHKNSIFILETRDAPLWHWGLMPIVPHSRTGPSRPREPSSLYTAPCMCFNHCFQMFHTPSSLFS